MIAPLVLAVDFLNFTYSTNPCYTNVPVPAVMQKGSFSYWDSKMGAGFDLHVDAVHTGSLSPGTSQAVVVIACDYPVGGTSAAYLYDVRANNAVLFGKVGDADWGPDWGAGPQAIHVRFAGKLLYVDSCANPDCTKRVVNTYTIQNGKIVVIRRK